MIDDSDIEIIETSSQSSPSRYAPSGDKKTGTNVNTNVHWEVHELVM